MSELHRPYREPADEPAPQLFDARYPDTSLPPAPADLGWRARRRWKRDAHRARRQATSAHVASWRQLPPDTGLGVALLAIALVVAAVVLWPRPDPAPPAPPAPPSQAEQPTPVAPSTARSNETGTDVAAAQPPAPPGLLDDDLGQLVHRFVLAYATYSPTGPDPVDRWVDTWVDDATDTLREQAVRDAGRLWAFTARQGVHVIDPRVVDGSRAGDTWTLLVERTLFPVGGGEDSPLEQQQVPVTVTAADGLVTAVEVG